MRIRHSPPQGMKCNGVAATSSAGTRSAHRHRRWQLLPIVLSASLLLVTTSSALVVRTPPSVASWALSTRARRFLYMASTNNDTAPRPSGMKASEIRTELESYGISTKSFLEKKDLVAALEKARKEGKKPKQQTKKASKSSAAAAEQTEASSNAAVNGKDDDEHDESASAGQSRDERLQAEKTKARALKVGELKKALQDMGVSTKSFFEKTEFVNAYAEAMVDGPPSSRGKQQKAATTPPKEDEPYDSSYRDVVMKKMSPRDLGVSFVIDVPLMR